MENYQEILQGFLPNTIEGMSYDDTLDVLELYCKNSIEEDFNQFIQLLYRIDVDEEKFNAVMHQSKREELYRNVAELILQRLILKYQLRQKYSNN